MQNRIVVSISKSSIDVALRQHISSQALREIACAAQDNVDRLRGGIKQCVYLAVVASEDVASAMIDHAIELSAQADDADERYGYAASVWDGLRASGLVEGGRRGGRLPPMLLQLA